MLTFMQYLNVHFLITCTSWTMCLYFCNKFLFISVLLISVFKWSFYYAENKNRKKKRNQNIDCNGYTVAIIFRIADSVMQIYKNPFFFLTYRFPFCADKTTNCRQPWSK